MTLNLHAPKTEEQLQPRITVVGVGGAGGNAVNNMINSNLEGVEFLVSNTDAQALTGSSCPQRLQLGRNITQGLGAGSRPDVGRAAAEEAIDEIMAHLDGSNMVFITAGMGGGTGTGAAPVIARAAREKGILTVGVVTKPFHFEGVHRMRLAEQGIQELHEYVDTLIIIPNQNLFRVANEKTTFADAFKMADDVLYSGVRGVTDLMVMPGLINLDFADIRSVMTEMGKAMMGTGESADESRAIAAAEAAISNPLLDDVSMKGARGVLINITGGPDMTLFEVDEAANRIRDEVDPDANIIFGSTFDQSLEGTMRVSVVATGIDAEEVERPKPVTLSVVSSQGKQAEQAKAQPAAAAAREERPATQPATAEAAQSGGQAAEMPAMAATGTDGFVETYPSQETAAGTVHAAQPAPAAQEPEAEAGADREDAFIAPAPVQAPRQPRQAQPHTEPEARGAAAGAQQPDPFAAAAAANGSRSDTERAAKPAKSRGRSLFARVTGAARSIQSGDRDKDAPRRSEEPRLNAGRGEPTGAGAAPSQPHAQAQAQPQGQGQAQPQPRREQEQPRLSGLDPKDRQDRTQDEDQLDIPAFLRRQAN
jgi:cell division protein FtsZ